MRARWVLFRYVQLFQFVANEIAWGAALGEKDGFVEGGTKVNKEGQKCRCGDVQGGMGEERSGPVQGTFRGGTGLRTLCPWLLFWSRSGTLFEGDGG